MMVAASDLAFHRGRGPSFIRVKNSKGDLLLMAKNIIKKRKRKARVPYSSLSFTTGDIGLNIDRFNQAAGTVEGSEAGIGGEGALCEAKRYVRRYLARPMNQFCSNKAEVLKLLVDIGDQNCTIYTLNNLGDEKDISKLTSRDIIYTYDEGILRDKNGIPVLDYDLSIKKEENRKKFADPDPNSKEFKAEYEDRITTATELEENFFNLDFDDVNAYGEKLNEAKEMYCSLCGEPIEGKGHSTENGIVCDGCELHFAIGG